MPDLYPAFALPTLYVDGAEKTATFLPAPMFDFEAGDFVRDAANRVVFADGRDAYRQWCGKVINTQVAACLAYPGIGIDGESARALERRDAVEAALEKTISDALGVHPATKRVSDLICSWAADVLEVRFSVEAADWAAFDMAMSVAV